VTGGVRRCRGDAGSVFATTFAVTIFLSFLAFAVTLSLHLSSRSAVSSAAHDAAAAMAAGSSSDVAREVGQLETLVDRMGGGSVSTSVTADGVVVVRALVQVRTSQLHRLFGIDVIDVTARVRQEVVR
jgi:Flp pilus assembly protein TadG